jgi:DNA polymerase III subunit alpha
MKTSRKFVHLHNHTEYSFLDGAIRIPDLVERAVRFGMPALAITDHGGLFGAVEFYDTCVAKGIKPVLGFEAYIAPGSRFDKHETSGERSYHHLVLLARDSDGWKNLMRLSTIGYTEGFYYKPRIDLEVLREHAGGIIATSACIAGAVPRALSDGKRELAKKIAQEYQSIFGEKNFYFELQNHGIDEEIIAFDEMIKLGRELGIPFIVTNDAHYLNKEDAVSHEVLLCIQTQTTMADPNRYKFSSDQVYFKSTEEMEKLFPDMPEALANTIEIAERCNVSIHAKPQLPVPPVPEGFSSPEDYLRKLALEGLRKKYPKVTKELEERLEHELGMICSMGFAGYFLIVLDFIGKAHEKEIMVGARGSVAGSLVAHVIGITDVDPMRFDLIFERFLNPERITMPDADIDLADKGRQEVIDYVIGRYGRNAVCQIINYIRMKAKMVVKDVARAMGVPLAEANRLSSMVSEKTLEESLAANGELARTVKGNPQYQELFRHACVLQGLTRQAGMHAGGLIIARGDVVNWAPLFKQSGTDIVMTQFDMNNVEKVGLIKMDLLGLRTLTVLQETVQLVKKYYERTIDLWKIPENDEKTYLLFGNGDTIGVFQFDSQGMQDYLRKLKPTNIEDLIAMAALYRPGPMENIDTYIHRKHGKEKVRYPHPDLGAVLDVTYGVIIYQEQVMRIAQRLAGFSLGDADVLRKAMGKKKAEAMEDMRKDFIDGAVARRIDKRTANEVFDLMAKFAQYGFNKAHATTYAHVAYQCAYLKAHYPLEYLTANLTSYFGNQDEFLKVKNEAERMNITLLPPEVNASDHNCTIEDGHIRFGLMVVKNVGQAADDILEARVRGGRFSSLFDLCKRVDLRKVNKKCLESLVFAGALDCLKGTRAQLAGSIDMAMEYGAAFQKDRLAGQANLFDDLGSGTAGEAAMPEPSLADVEPWPFTLALQREKELLGFYVSGHPLDRFQDEIRGFSTMSLNIEELEKVKDGEMVTVGGLVTSVKNHLQRDGRQMAFLEIEDFDGKVELLIFGDVYEKFRSLLIEDAMVLVHGAFSRREREEKPKIRVDTCMALSDARTKLAKSVHVRLHTAGLEQEFLKGLYRQCAAGGGECVLILHLVTAEGNEYRVRARNIRVASSFESVKGLRELLGKENVWIGKTVA